LAEAWFVSSDSHVVEPPDLWVGRIDSKFGDRVPHQVAEPGGDWWYAGGTRIFSVTGGTETGVRFKDQSKMRLESRYSEVVEGGYVPEKKLEDMDTDGVYGEVIYPTLGIPLWRLPDTKLLNAIHLGYNDWIADFCAADRRRLKGVAMVNLDDVEWAVAELERAAKQGLAGAMITVYPDPERSFDRPIYEPFWAAAQDLGMPLSLHIGTSRLIPRARKAESSVVDAASNSLGTPASYATAAHWVQMSLSHLIFSGVFERYPGLQVVSLEHEVAWAGHFLNVIDYTYTQRVPRPDWYRFKDGALPSDFFHRNVFISFQEDALGIQIRSTIGVDNLMWGSDYPHAESTFPRSREILDEILREVPEDERRKLVRDNAARLYRFDINGG